MNRNWYFEIGRKIPKKILGSHQINNIFKTKMPNSGYFMGKYLV